MVRWNWPITGYGSQNQMLAHFGLGDATVVDSLVVRWPDGTYDVRTGIDSGSVRVGKSGRSRSTLGRSEGGEAREYFVGTEGPG